MIFTVDGPPVAWQRARRRGGRYFTDPRSGAYHDYVGLRYQAERGTRHEGPVAVWLTFVCEMPKSKRTTRKIHPRRWKTTKPDLDNLAKGILDALNGIAWHDDNQVAWLNAQKLIRASDEQPHCEVRIEPLPTPDAIATAPEAALESTERPPP